MATARIQTPLRRVRHFGSAHEGTTHFWWQRLTALANLVLGLIALFVILSVVGKPYPDVVATLSSPFVAVVLFLLIVSVAIHMRLGMQVVIEDYIHSEGLKIGCLIANTFFAVAIAAISGIAILKLALGG